MVKIDNRNVKYLTPTELLGGCPVTFSIALNVANFEIIYGRCVVSLCRLLKCPITGRSFALGGHLEPKICYGKESPALRKTAVVCSYYDPLSEDDFKISIILFGDSLSASFFK